jgi:hypothetical protein
MKRKTVDENNNKNIESKNTFRKRRKKTSDSWNFFKEIELDNILYGECIFKTCGQKIKVEDTTSGLEKHLNNVHKIAREDYFLFIKDSNQQTLFDYNNKPKISLEEKIDNIAIAFAINSLPYSLINEKYFQKAFNTWNLTPYKLKKVVKENFIKVNEKIKNEISNKNNTLGVDGWSPKYSKELIYNFMFLTEKEYYAKSIIIDKDESKENISNLLKNFIIEIEKEYNIIIIAIVSDNCIKITSAVQSLINSFRLFLIHIRCLSHSINLIFTDLKKQNNLIYIKYLKLINSITKTIMNRK